MGKLRLIALMVTALCASSASLTGVWKADLQQSKVGGPPLTSYAEIVEQQGAQVTEKIFVVRRREDRGELVFTTDGKPTIVPYGGIPSRLTANQDGDSMVLTLEQSGRPETTKRRYLLASDGQTLTITEDGQAEGRDTHNVYVLQKQPDAAAEEFRKPEALASAVFKNVKTPLKDLTHTQFIDQMHYFTWALHQQCTFCHVQGNFESDDKEEKRTARTMIQMVGNINQKFFDSKPEVKCFTCHEFRSHPLARPQFEGEPEHHHQEQGHEHTAADHKTGD